MKYDLQQQLNEYFHAPEPEKKKLFLRNLGKRETGLWDLLKSQICYISKYAWLASTLLFFLSFLFSRLIPIRYMGILYALMPLFVMVSITESMRSYPYGMYELEQACRFSLKSIILTRMFLLGTGNFIMILLLAFFSRYPVFSQFIYMVVPYLITAIGNLIIVRKFRNREGTYLCFGFSVLIAFLIAAGFLKYEFIFHAAYLSLWTIASVLFLILFIKEIYHTIQVTEDFAWN